MLGIVALCMEIPNVYKGEKQMTRSYDHKEILAAVDCSGEYLGSKILFLPYKDFLYITTTPVSDDNDETISQYILRESKYIEEISPAHDIVGLISLHRCMKEPPPNFSE